jgi:hypothetical protein
MTIRTIVQCEACDHTEDVVYHTVFVTTLPAGWIKVSETSKAVKTADRVRHYCSEDCAVNDFTADAKPNKDL